MSQVGILLENKEWWNKDELKFFDTFLIENLGMRAIYSLAYGCFNFGCIMAALIKNRVEIYGRIGPA